MFLWFVYHYARSVLCKGLFMYVSPLFTPPHSSLAGSRVRAGQLLLQPRAQTATLNCVGDMFRRRTGSRACYDIVGPSTTLEICSDAGPDLRFAMIYFDLSAADQHPNGGRIKPAVHCVFRFCKDLPPLLPMQP